MYGERYSHIQSPNVFASPSYVTKNYNPVKKNNKLLITVHGEFLEGEKICEWANLNQLLSKYGK